MKTSSRDQTLGSRAGLRDVDLGAEPSVTYVSYDRTLICHSPVSHPGFEHPVCGLSMALQYKHPFHPSTMSEEPPGAAAVNDHLRVSWSSDTGFVFSDSTVERASMNWAITEFHVTLATGQAYGKDVEVPEDVFLDILNTHVGAFEADRCLQSVSYCLDLDRVSEGASARLNALLVEPSHSDGDQRNLTTDVERQIPRPRGPVLSRSTSCRFQTAYGEVEMTPPDVLDWYTRVLVPALESGIDDETAWLSTLPRYRESPEAAARWAALAAWLPGEVRATKGMVLDMVRRGYCKDVSWLPIPRTLSLKDSTALKQMAITADATIGTMVTDLVEHFELLYSVYPRYAAYQFIGDAWEYALELAYTGKPWEDVPRETAWTWNHEQFKDEPDLKPELWGLGPDELIIRTINHETLKSQAEAADNQELLDIATEALAELDLAIRIRRAENQPIRTGVGPH